jgi:hypothetical protein
MQYNLNGNLAHGVLGTNKPCTGAGSEGADTSGHMHYSVMEIFIRPS